MTFPLFPFSVDTSTNETTKFNPRLVNLIEGQKEQQKARDLLDSWETSQTVSIFLTDLTTAEAFILSLQGYYPFELLSKNWICLSYSIQYERQNQGIFSMELVEYTNPS